MSVEVDIIISAPAWESVSDLEALANGAVQKAALMSGAVLADDCELCVSFGDDEAIHALNAQWRKQDKATNVLSFPTPGELAAKPMLGDIVIAHETVAREAREQDKDFREYTTYMIVHGFLHLIGYDHETSADAEIMEGLEQRIARALGLSDPYEGTLPGATLDSDEPHKDHVDES